MLEVLRKKNPLLSIYSIKDCEFESFGKRLDAFDIDVILSYLHDETTIPESGNSYQASDLALEKLEEMKILCESVFGQMEFQAGYCNGNGHQLNSLEYHKSSEINIAATDLVLMLADVRQIQNNEISSEVVQCFYLPAGTAVELYATTLHFAPCKVEPAGFRCLVALPRFTNTLLDNPIERKGEEGELLFMKNKWLIAHPDGPAAQNGAYIGINGDNIKLIL